MVPLDSKEVSTQSSLGATWVFCSCSTELYQDNSHAAERWDARSQCLGKDLVGWEQEGILDKHGSFNCHNVIHLERALSAPSQRNSPEGSPGQPRPPALLKQTGRVCRAPPNLLQSSHKNHWGKFHSPQKFYSSRCYLTDFPEKNPVGPKMTISIHTHIYEYIYIYTHIYTHTGEVAQVLLALII